MGDLSHSLFEGLLFVSILLYFILSGKKNFLFFFLLSMSYMNSQTLVG